MGLTVEIQFIAVEWLDGDNNSKCDGDSTISIKIKAAGGGRKQGFHNWLHCLKETNSYMIPVTARFADVFALCFQTTLANKVEWAGAHALVHSSEFSWSNSSKTSLSRSRQHFSEWPSFSVVSQMQASMPLLRVRRSQGEKVQKKMERMLK